MFAALPPLPRAIWTLRLLSSQIPQWTGMSAWVSSIHGVRPQGGGHTADGSQRAAKVTSSLHPVLRCHWFVCVCACVCVCVCVYVYGHVFAGSHLSTMRTGKRGPSNYVGWHNRWYLIYLWNYKVHALHIVIKLRVKGISKMKIFTVPLFCIIHQTWGRYTSHINHHCILIPCSLSGFLWILISTDWIYSIIAHCGTWLSDKCQIKCKFVYFDWTLSSNVTEVKLTGGKTVKK